MQEFEQIQRAQRGDLKCMEELLQQNYPILKGYLLKVTLDREVALDLTQETMLKAIKKIRKFKGHAKFSTWLIAIASNLYKDYLKKNRRIVVMDNLDKLQSYSVAENIDQEEINELLIGLPEEKRMVLILKHYFGYNYEEIGKMLDIPVGTVKSRMYYCMNFLKKQIERRGRCE